MPIHGCQFMFPCFSPTASSRKRNGRQFRPIALSGGNLDLREPARLLEPAETVSPRAPGERGGNRGQESGRVEEWRGGLGVALHGNWPCQAAAAALTFAWPAAAAASPLGTAAVQLLAESPHTVEDFLVDVFQDMEDAQLGVHSFRPAIPLRLSVAVTCRYSSGTVSSVRRRPSEDAVRRPVATGGYGRVPNKSSRSDLVTPGLFGFYNEEDESR